MSQRGGGQSPLPGYGERLQLIFGWPSSFFAPLSKHVDCPTKHQLKQETTTKKTVFQHKAANMLYSAILKTITYCNFSFSPCFRGESVFMDHCRISLRRIFMEKKSQSLTLRKLTSANNFFYFFFPFSANVLFAHQSRCLPRLLP